MAKAKTTKKSVTSSAEDLNERIVSEYKKFVLLNGRDPNSVFEFAVHLDIDEQAFYEYFSSFNAINRYLWLSYFDTTYAGLLADKNYTEYSVREKLLAFYYTLIEVLKKDRSYVKYSYGKSVKPQMPNPALADFKSRFHEYINQLIGEGIENQEIMQRKVVGDRYFDGIWVQFNFIVGYWLKDDSPNFENSDAAIEKSVNLSFELMGRSTIDSVVDFAKFVFKSNR